MNYETRQNRDAIIMTPATPPSASVIWLHGLGADGTDFVPLVPQLRLPETQAPRFIFPNAPVRPVTVNNGMSMRAWYDIYSLVARDREDAAGIQASATLVHGLIEQQRTAGIAANRIVLAGFSQGGAVALQAGLRYGQPLAGILSLSAYLPLAATLEAEASTANRGVAILMCHGNQDPIVPLDMARKSFAALTAQGYRPQLLEYPMPHSLCGEEVIAISRWLAQILPPL
jgi:phospholipase/carboxylesterase